MVSLKALSFVQFKRTSMYIYLSYIHLPISVVRHLSPFNGEGKTAPQDF